MVLKGIVALFFFWCSVRNFSRRETESILSLILSHNTGILLLHNIESLKWCKMRYKTITLLLDKRNKVNTTGSPFIEHDFLII